MLLRIFCAQYVCLCQVTHFFMASYKVPDTDLFL
jgi:hypothetical protein